MGEITKQQQDMILELVFTDKGRELFTSVYARPGEHEHEFQLVFETPYLQQDLRFKLAAAPEEYLRQEGDIGANFFNSFFDDPQVVELENGLVKFVVPLWLDGWTSPESPEQINEVARRTVESAFEEALQWVEDGDTPDDSVSYLTAYRLYTRVQQIQALVKTIFDLNIREIRAIPEVNEAQEGPTGHATDFEVL